MKAAQVALAVLVAVLIAAGTALFIADENAPAWVFTGFGLFGFVMLVGMIGNDARVPRNLPPPR